MSRRSSIAGIPPQYTFVPQAPVPGPSSHHPTTDLTMLRTHAPNQPTASAHQPALTYRSASISMAGIPTHSAASPTYTTSPAYPYTPSVPTPGVSSPSPDVYWRQLDDYIVRRLNDVLKWQADAMSAQDARLAKCEEALKACITEARSETTQQNDRIAQQNEHMAQQNERANIILKALCDHAKGLDDKVDRLSKAIGVEVKEGEPATSLSSRVKDVEWTMGELLERIGDPLALDPNAPQQPFVNTHRPPPVIRHEVAVETSPAPGTPPPAPRTPTPPPPLVVRHEMATSPIRFMDVDDEQNDVADDEQNDAEDERIDVEDERIDVEDEQEDSERSNDTTHPLTPISAPVARHRGGDVQKERTQTPVDRRNTDPASLFDEDEVNERPEGEAIRLSRPLAVRTNTLGLAPRTKPLAPQSSMPSPTPSVRGRTVSAEESVPACTTMASERAEQSSYLRPPTHDSDLRPPNHDSDLRLPTPDATVRYSSVPGDMAVDEDDAPEMQDDVEDMPEMWTDDPIEDFEEGLGPHAEGREDGEDAHGRDGEGAHGQTESRDSNTKKASASLPKKPSASLPKKPSAPLPKKNPSTTRRPLAVQPSEDSVAVNAYLLGRSSPAVEADGPPNSFSEHAETANDAGDASDSDLSSLSSLSDVEDVGAAGKAGGGAAGSARTSAGGLRPTAATSGTATAVTGTATAVSGAATAVSGTATATSEPPRSRYAAQFQAAAGRSSLQPKSKGKEKSAAATRIKRRRADDDGAAPAKRARVGDEGPDADASGPTPINKGKIQQIKEEEGEQMLSSSSSRSSSVRRGRSGSARGGSAREDSARRGRSGSLRQEKSAIVKQEKGEKKRGRPRKKPQWPKLVEGSGSTFWTTECDRCGQWYHNGCVGLDKEADSDAPFCCPFCVVDPHYKDTVKKVHEGMCMRPDCPHEIDVENYLGEYEIDYLVGRFVKISSQQPKQEWYLVKWAKPWTIDDCTWQIPSDFSPDFIHKFNETAATEGRGGSQDLTLTKEAEDGLRANPNVGWNRFEPIGSVLHMLDDEN